MNQNDDEQSNINDDDQEEEEDEEEYNDIKSNLNKISWLPSVKLGKQPYRPGTFGRQAVSRKENVDGDGYESLDGSGSDTGNDAPPGYQNIEILPVLPMTMVHGLEGMLMTSNPHDDEESIDNSDRDNNLFYNGPESYYSAGVWEEDTTSSSMVSASSLGPLFSGTSSYLPHTKGHVFTVAEPKYKKLYDDLIRMGNYYGMKKDSAMRRAAKEEESMQQDNGEGGSEITGEGASNVAVPTVSPTATSSLPDPDEKRRFIVTTTNPAEEGVFAEYGLLFQLKDLDEVAAVAEMGGEEEEGMMTLDELQDLVESVDAQQGYDSGGMDDGGEDIMDILLRTHYEATHDVVGRVKIHRFVNPECYGPEGEEYLMAEATVLDNVENDRVKMLEERIARRATATAAAQVVEEEPQPTITSTSLTTAARVMEEQAQAMKEQQAVVSDNVAKAVARIKEELRSTVGEAFKQQQSQQPQQVDPERIKDKLRAALDEAPGLSSSKSSSDASNTSSNRKKGGPIPLSPKGILVERRSTESLTTPERALRESFAKLVALQHDLKEECRFTRVSVQTFGIGPVGVWLSAAAWSQFVEKRLEASFGDMQSDLQDKLGEYLGLDGQQQGGATNEGGGYFTNKEGGGYFSNKYPAEDAEDGDMEGTDTIDFDDLSPELQQEFQLVQARATTELGPLALERAIQMQRIVQAESYVERLDLLRECVENERRRLEAKKMLRSLAFGGGDGNDNDNDGKGGGGERFVSSGATSISREEARSTFERLMATSTEDVDKKYDPSKEDDEEAFQ